MAMGTRKHRERQEQLWVTHTELATAPGHPFYKRLNELLDGEKFDEFAESECARFYAHNNGRPSLPPGSYFRLLLIGYFEGIDSERGMAWRVADSLGLRSFLRIGLDEDTPDHSTISRTRRLMDVETHPQGVPVGTGSAGGSRAVERQNGGSGCDHAGSQCGHAVHGAAGQRS
jgi:transposase